MRSLRGLAALVAIITPFGISCPGIYNAGPVQTTEQQLSITIDGLEHPAASFEVTLCQGIPDVLELNLLQRGPQCPEQHRPGGIGAPASRGRICLEFHLKLQKPGLGEEVPARGSSHAQLTFEQHLAPAFRLWTGDAGPRDGAPTGTIQVVLLEPRGSQYAVGISARVQGDGHDVVAAGTTVATPVSCLSAGPGG